MKLLKRFLTLSHGKQIAVAVYLLHFLVILGLLGHHLATKRLSPQRPIVVRTLSLQPIPKIVAPLPSSQIAKPKTKKIAPARECTHLSTLPKTLAPVDKKKPLLYEVAARLETLREQAKQTRTPLTLPSKIQSKAKIALSKIDPTYGELLIAYLQNELDLPEYGEVKVKIEIDRFGTLVDCEIVEAKSRKNAEFLKNRLPELAFPCLNDPQSFTITFRNVEMH